VSNGEGITDDVRKREEEYFRRQDRELIEKMRKASETAKEREALQTQTGIHDPEMLQQLQELGFTPQTVALLPLIPILQVAWAEGGVSTAERTAICSLARSRGIREGSDADRQLTEWLDRRPSADTFRKAMRLIAAMVDHPGEGFQDVTADDVLEYAEQIAQASGGLFGIGAVSAEERAALEQIASQLKGRG
jgi:tellurite resistance protein